MRRLLPLLLALFSASPAVAHFVWLEPVPGGSPTACFGEWSEQVRESREGLLGRLTAPRAFSAAGGDLALKPVPNGVEVQLPGNAGEPGDLRFEAFLFPEKGTTLIHYQARLGREQGTSLLPLELVPVTPGASRFVLHFRGRPLGDTAVTLFTSAGWSRSFRTDASGVLDVETPWPGPCILEVAHLEKLSGTHAGRSHEAVRHVATLYFTVPQS